MNSIQRNILAYLNNLKPNGHDAYGFVEFLSTEFKADNSDVIYSLNELEDQKLIELKLDELTQKQKYVISNEGFAIVSSLLEQNKGFINQKRLYFDELFERSDEGLILKRDIFISGIKYNIGDVLNEESLDFMSNPEDYFYIYSPLRDGDSLDGFSPLR